MSGVGQLRIPSPGGPERFALRNTVIEVFVVSEDANGNPNEWAIQLTWEADGDPVLRNGDFFLRPAQPVLEELVGQRVFVDGHDSSARIYAYEHWNAWASLDVLEIEGARVHARITYYDEDRETPKEEVDGWFLRHEA